MNWPEAVSESIGNMTGAFVLLGIVYCVARAVSGGWHK
jgi:hypothetical protein